MRLLMLGGTEFAGRAVTEAALARGWQVTVFHRGRHAPPPGVRALPGDRSAAGGLAALAAGEGDAVVDTLSEAPAPCAPPAAAPDCTGAHRSRCSPPEPNRGRASRSGCRRAARTTTTCTGRRVTRIGGGTALPPGRETAAGTWEWLCRIGGGPPSRPDRPPPGLDEETEARLLAMPVRLLTGAENRG